MAARHGRPARPAAATGTTRPTVALMVVGGVLVALIGAAGVVALLRSGNATASGATAGRTSSPSPSQTSTATSPTTAPATTGPATSSPGATAPATAPGAKPASHVFRGTGNKILKINKPGAIGSPVLVAATHRGSGSFGVLALDSTMHEGDILINVAGPYSGTTLLDARGTQTQHLKVLAHGPWTLTIKPVSAARSVDLHAKGTGDDVLRYTGVKGLATFDYRGGLNFVVSYYGNATAVLVNKVGGYHGMVRIQQGPALIDVNANGPWTMRVAP